MSAFSILATSTTGMQQSLDRVAGHAHALANTSTGSHQASTQTGTAPANTAVTDHLVGLKAESAQFKALAMVSETAGEMLGTLIDEMA